MKKLVCLVLLLLLGGLVSGCGTTTQAVREVDTIKIGYFGPQTGPVSSVGVPVADAAVLAVKEINAKGGINGMKVEILVEDSQCVAKNAASIANKFIHIDKVDVIVVGVCSSDVLAAAPIAEQSKTVLISSVAGSPKITDAGDYVFRISASSVQFGKAMADMVWDAGHRNVSVIYEDNDYPIGFYQEFRKNFESYGGEVVSVQSYDFGSTDFRTPILKVKHAEPDALVFLPIGMAGAGLFLKEAEELEIGIPIFGQDVVSSDATARVAGDAADGTSVVVYDFDLEDPMMESFVEDFQEEYGVCEDCLGGVPELYYATLGYDVVNLLADALVGCGDSECLRDSLYSVEDWKGTSGMITIDENGDTERQFDLKRYVGSELQEV